MIATAVLTETYKAAANFRGVIGEKVSSKSKM